MISGVSTFFFLPWYYRSPSQTIRISPTLLLTAHHERSQEVAIAGETEKAPVMLQGLHVVKYGKPEQLRRICLTEKI